MALGEDLFDSVKIIAEAEIAKVKFDETIVCTIVDAINAKEGKYLVSNGGAKFYAYCENTDYQNNEMVMVTIPQGNYNNQKMIVGKYIVDNNTPFTYKSPFSQIVDLTNNLIDVSTSYAFWANGTNYIWDKAESDYVFTGNATNPVWERTDLHYSKFTRIGLRGDFSTWLGDYGVTSGDYGLALKVTFTNSESSKSFIKWVHFNSSEFFGDIYNFETFYSQEITFDISQFIDYTVTGMALYIYQRDNFYTTNGEKISASDIADGIINPNIFIKDLYVCLGVDAETFGDDTLDIAVAGSTRYHRNSPADKPETADQRDQANKKEISAQWVHKYDQTNDIKIVDNYEFPNGYKIQWYKQSIGASSTSKFLGAHWVKLSAEDSSLSTGESNQVFQIYFTPDAQKQSELIIALITKQEGATTLLIAKSNVVELVNDDEIPHNPTMENINALGIEYDDPFGFRGNFLLYNRANVLGKKEWAKTAFSLQAVFNETLGEAKAPIPDYSLWGSTAAGDKWESIEWIFPKQATMIKCLEAEDPQSSDENYAHIKNKVKVNYGIRDKLNRSFINNTVQLIVKKDTITYTASVQMLFGTAGTSGSDYTIIVNWEDNALIPGRSLSGDVALIDEAGTIVNDITGNYKYSWYKIGDTTNNLTKVIKTSKVYCPVLTSDSQSIVAYSNVTDAEKYYIVESSPSLTGAKYYKMSVDSNDNSMHVTLEDAINRNQQLYKLADKTTFYFNEVELTDDSTDSTKILWTANKRYFVCYDNVYMLDPWDKYYEGEVYYVPVASNEYEYESTVLNSINNISSSGPNNSHFTINAPSNLSMDSLFILQITLEGFGNYNLIDRYPVALKKSDDVRFIEGPTYVRYASTGEIDYEKNPYKIVKQIINELNTTIVKQGYDIDEVFGHWELKIYPNEYLTNPKLSNFNPELLETYPPNLDDNNSNNKPLYVMPKLAPVSVYIPGDLIYGVQFFDDSISGTKNQRCLWTQPIVVYQDNYPSTTLNKWDGKSIQTDDDTGTIVANGLAAGKKENQDNTFTGVVLGDWSRSDIDGFVSKNTGIYGFNHGAMSYAFKDDGTGFIGKDGRGRIYFNGNNAQIYSSNWRGNQQLGMFLDVDDGILKMNKTGAYITLSTQESTYPLSIGSGSSPLQRNFRVQWDGTMWATNGNFQGTITGSSVTTTYLFADNGQIGGWYIDQTELRDAATHAAATTILSSANKGSLTTNAGYIGGWKIMPEGIQSYDGKTTLFNRVEYASINSGFAHIVTPVIKLTGRLVGDDMTAYMGSFRGKASKKNGELVDTHVMGMYSDDHSLVFQSMGNTDNYNNVAIRAAGDTFMQGGYNFTDATYKTAIIAGDDGKVAIIAEKIEFSTPAASDQSGIYARFA